MGGRRGSTFYSDVYSVDTTETFTKIAESEFPARAFHGFLAF
jgi:hypothetical protein